MRVRFGGELFSYGNQVPFPVDFAFVPQLGDGRFTVRFVRAHERIELSLDSDAVQLDVGFTARSPLFDFADFDHANPGVASMAEIVQFGSNQQSVHQHQGMRTSGSVTVKTGEQAGRTYAIDGLGYRDHSRMVRCDNMVKSHVWSGLHFPGHVFGAMMLTGLHRPETPAPRPRASSRFRVG